MNQSQIYNESGLGGESAQGTPGGNRGNYRKVFKPNLPATKSEIGANDTNSNDSVDAANAMALGYTPNS